MSEIEPKRLYLPKADRSFWRCEQPAKSSLLYLAWGYRDFHRERIPVSCHEGAVCVLIQEGCPTLILDGTPLRMPAGTLALIGPDCPFGWSQSGKGPCRFLLWMWRCITDRDLREASGSGHRVGMLNRKERKPMALLHDLCRREVLHPQTPDPGYIEGCRMIFEATLKRAFQDGTDPQPQASLLSEQVQSWMCAHLDSKEPIARLCDYLNLSQSTLYRLFTAEVGMSPSTRFHQLKMQKANELLVGTRLSIKEIAFQLGYEHFNDFSRAYRKHFGHCPTLAR